MSNILKSYDKNNSKININDFVVCQYGKCKVLEILDMNRIGIIDLEGNKIIEYGENCEIK